MIAQSQKWQRPARVLREGADKQYAIGQGIMERRALSSDIRRCC
jgi:hypothetical protein